MELKYQEKFRQPLRGCCAWLLIDEVVRPSETRIKPIHARMLENKVTLLEEARQHLL